MTDEVRETPPTRSRRRRWAWIASVLLLAVCIALVAGTIVLRRATPIVKWRILETLGTRFNARVELDDLDASLLHGIEVTGTGLRILPPNDVVAAGETHPLISVERFTFRSGLMSLFERPMRVGSVYVSGLSIYIPPKELRQRGVVAPAAKRHGKIEIAVDEIVCDASRLTIGTLKPGKEPKEFELRHIVLHHVGPNQPWRYDATVVNAIPTGNIHATGDFGPWVTESPGDSFLSGGYTFDRADLGTIRGIGGTLSSTGKFIGQLNRIAVTGETRTPDFSLDSANHPMPLSTQFQAVVDGLTGDTYLNAVAAQLGGTRFTTHGAVVNVKGVGHTIDLDVNVPAGRIQDFLALAVKTQPTVVTGTFATQTRLHIAPGKERVMEKMQLGGAMRLTQIHFTNPKVEDKVDELSLRAQGDPKDAKPGAEDVRAAMTGQFVLRDSRFTVSKLVYTIPGAQVNLDGIYSLDGEQFDFHGQVATQAKLSQMVASPWKSFLLKAVDPFFKGEHGGSQIPVRISGTKSEPKFGLDLHYKDESKIDAQADRGKK